MPPSKAIMATAENWEWAPPERGSVSPSSSSPSAVSETPIHWRRPTPKPNSRSAITASRTTPPERTDCTIEIGASASAPTCRIQAPTATSIPIANHLDENRHLALRRGWRMSTDAAAHAPRYL